MPALIDLLTSFSGLLSLAVIAFICLMAAYLTRLALRKMEEDSRVRLHRDDSPAQPARNRH